ncbi:SDR family oxidoreductase, partial [Curtobacterium sp. P97]|uniref:SDR family NAD(P)-dependent oxidoreductase n=1 Tax=Curtobacterium sp. P97 TaxID=2939562 RepID=UPI00203A7730
LRRLLTRRTWSGTGRVVVVTGGAGGIGSVLCHRLAGRGASVVVVDRDGGRAAAVAAGLPGPGQHVALAGDLTDPARVEAVLAEVGSRYGRVDVLVNNTGMTSAERFGERSLASIDREITVNTLSPLYVTRLALPLL